MMTILLIIGAITYDITSYVDITSILIGDAIDETLGSGGFTIPYIKTDTIGFDMSNPIPMFSQIVIEDDETFYYVVGEDNVTLVRKTNPLYEHKVTLIEPTKILQRRVIPDQTIRQPQGDLSDYDYVINSIDEATFSSTGYSGYTGFFIDSNYDNITFLNGLSTDTSVIDGTLLKQTIPYTINFEYIVYNSLELGGINVTCDLLVDGVVQSTDTFYVDKASISKPGEVKKYMSLSYTPSSVNEYVTVRFKTGGQLQSGYVGISSMKIQARTGVDVAKYTLDQVVDKLLASVEVFKLGEENYEFTLSDETRARISNIDSPEFTWQGYTLYEALQECAGYVRAQVYLGQDDFNTIYFYFYDDEINEVGIDYLEEEHHLTSNDYATSLEINAQNVIKEDSNRYVKYEPYGDGYMRARLNQDGFGQITDNNSSVLLKQNIYRITEFNVRGIAFTMYDGGTPVNFGNTVSWNIVDFVVENTKYNALLNTSSSSLRGSTLDKGNAMYYVQGQNRILNLSYNDVLRPPSWMTPDPLNYAVVEAVLCQAQIENPTYTFSSEYLISVDMEDVEFNVAYIPYSNARVSVYKSELGLEKSVMYFNEQAQLNDMKSLGDVAQSHVNRRSNKTSLYQGLVKNYNGLLRLGQKNARGEKLTRYMIDYSLTVKTLALEYTPNYVNISNFVGVPKAFRQWEVPNNNLVVRNDKFTQWLYLSETSIQTEQSLDILQAINRIWINFRLLDTGTQSKYARIQLDYDGIGYTDVVEGAVDTQVFGRTLAISVKMYDNYSAGAYIDTQGSIEYQKDARYTDDLGRVKKVKYQIYTNNDTKLYGNDYAKLYPSNDTTPVIPTLITELEYEINKDAGEIMAITEEFVFESNTDNIKVFNGFAKYNGIAMGSLNVTARPFLLKKGYFPTTEFINQSGLVSIPLIKWGTTISDNSHMTKITSPIGDYEGYIWIETKSNEPIFAVRTNNFDSATGTVEYNKTIYIGGLE